MAASKVRIEQGATLRLVLTYVLFASAWIGLSIPLPWWCAILNVQWKPGQLMAIAMLFCVSNNCINYCLFTKRE